MVTKVTPKTLTYSIEGYTGTKILPKGTFQVIIEYSEGKPLSAILTSEPRSDNSITTDKKRLEKIVRFLNRKQN